MLKKSDRKKPIPAFLLLLALAPFQLAAKGCDVAEVGEDGCPAGQTCSDGGDEKACGGLNGLACSDGEYCAYAEDAACGAADATGVCKPKPEACDLIYAPVCGCDDQTYGNACAAGMAGVSVATYGECETPGGDTCGGLAGEPCATGEFCDYPPDAACGAADATGVCKPTPEICADIYAPVCGCDDKTYSNACEANGAGVSVAKSGECASEPGGAVVCGGLNGASCASDEFCAYPLDALCGAADATGVCSSKPEACDAIYDPVCGCDDKTYGNDCEAAMAGISVAQEGACDEPLPGPTCGGFTAEQCAQGEYCYYPESAQCGAGDVSGVCMEMPTGCTDQYLPVCGCDGQTHSNSCEAAAAGTSVASLGECP